MKNSIYHAHELNKTIKKRGNDLYTVWPRFTSPAKALRIPHLDVLEVTVIVDSIVVIAGIFARQFLFWIINKMRTALFFYKKENTI
ncbi:MAG: hypothetical protein K5754_02510 [Butyrivibrio sp.]|jgi:hypothetical protein|nr:hypothetical protein [Butyrivibrio sp.]MCR4635077.1 hypothetical protein [Butyrivibrio sp.]